MNDPVVQLIRQERKRLETERREKVAELDKRIKGLDAALAALNGSGSGRPKRKSPKTVLKSEVLDVLSPDRPQPIYHLADRLGVSGSQVSRHLDKLQADGEARETTGQKRNRTFVRNQVKIHPGEGIVR